MEPQAPQNENRPKTLKDFAEQGRNIRKEHAQHFDKLKQLGKDVFNVAYGVATNREMRDEVKEELDKKAFKLGTEMRKNLDSLGNEVSRGIDNSNDTLHEKWRETRGKARDKTNELAAGVVAKTAELFSGPAAYTAEAAINAKGILENTLFQVGADLVDVTGEKVSNMTQLTLNRTEGAFNFAEEATTLLEHHRRTQKWGERFRRGLNFAEQVRNRVVDANNMGANLRRAANEIRTGSASKSRTREELKAEIHTNAEKMAKNGLDYLKAT